MNADSSAFTMPAWVVHMPCVDFERAVLEQLRRQGRGVGDGHDLIIVAMQDEGRHRDAHQVLGEIGLREGLDAIVMRLGAAHHALAPPVPDHRLRCRCARAVEAVERTGREIEVELRPVGGELPAQIVEDADRQTARIAFRLQHEWGDCADQHKLGHATAAVSRDIAHGFAAAGGMSDVDGIAQVKVVDDRRGIGRVMIHVVAVADLARASVTAAIVGDHAISLADEVQHLGIPVVGAKRPTMMKDHRLGGLRSPVLIEDPYAILRGH